MRIIAGRARGRRLTGPSDRAIRPTPDRVREALFSILGGHMEGWRVLDLFAGTGALGLEAKSRGAERVVLVDQSPQALRLCRRNAQATGLEEGVEILALSYEAGLARLAERGERFDLIVAAPPYPLETICSETLEALDAAPVLAPEGTLVLQHHHRNQAAPDASRRLLLYDRRRYGITALSFYRHRPTEREATPC